MQNENHLESAHNEIRNCTPNSTCLPIWGGGDTKTQLGGRFQTGALSSCLLSFAGARRRSRLCKSRSMHSAVDPSTDNTKRRHEDLLVRLWTHFNTEFSTAVPRLTVYALAYYRVFKRALCLGHGLTTPHSCALGPVAEQRVREQSCVGWVVGYILIGSTSTGVQ